MIKKAYIITEGGLKYGLGHIARCIYFYNGLMGMGFETTFIVDFDGIPENSMLNGINHHACSWIDNPDLIFEFVNKPDVLIIDSYHISESTIDKITSLTQKVVFIDDFMRLNYKKGIIVNHNLNSDKLFSDKLTNSNCQYFFGTRYLMLREEFLKHNGLKREYKTKPENILISFGGSLISCSHIHYIIETLLQLNKKSLNIKLLMNTNQIEYYKTNYGDLPSEIELISNKFELSELMIWADLAIISLGVTSLEMIWMGLPYIFTIIAPEQEYYKANYNNEGIISFDNEENLKDILTEIIDNDYIKYSRNLERLKNNCKLFDLNLI